DAADIPGAKRSTGVAIVWRDGCLARFRKAVSMARRMPAPPQTTRRVRRHFDHDFKAHAVRLVLDDRKSITSVARDVDVAESTLRAWVARSQDDRQHGPARLTPSEREELVRLRKENHELRIE